MTTPQSRLLKLADEAVADYNAMHAAGGEAVYPSWVEDVRLLCNAAPASPVSTVEEHQPARDWELTCHECDGSGHVYVKHQVAERKTDIQEFKEECECCQGRGFVFAFQDIPGIEEYVKGYRPAPAGVSTVVAQPAAWMEPGIDVPVTNEYRNKTTLRQAKYCVPLYKHAPVNAPAAGDAIRDLIAKHAELLERTDYAYFELARTRQTGWMAWLCSHPAETHPDRKVLARGQGVTPDEACLAALADFDDRAAIAAQLAREES